MSNATVFILGNQIIAGNGLRGWTVKHERRDAHASQTKGMFPNIDDWST
ncbi:MAG: hypothetical protein V2J20_04540 [Wenzhouxiangella sp.]|jgi:hypothetical protein|nr:hypothetical protein [Wenzhouxiangella sp.]